MPLSVEMPAPVSTQIRSAPVSQSGSGAGTSPITPLTVGPSLTPEGPGHGGDRRHGVRQRPPHPPFPGRNWDDQGQQTSAGQAHGNQRGAGAEEWQPARTASEHGRRSPSTARTTTSTGSTRSRAPTSSPSA